VNRRDYNRILPLLKQKRQRELSDVTRKSKSAMARIIADGLNRRTASRRRSDIEYAMEEGLLEILPNIERRTPYLATFANIATLLGLLGTIIGLIAAFTAVANADPAEKANLLSQSISIAMNTTAFGLMVAIPLLLVHSMLQSKTSAIVESLEIAVVKFLNLMEGDERTQAAPTSQKAAAKS
jgi:biopolymer transport protein ExbB/TolQ